jgi:hypothetical protein
MTAVGSALFAQAPYGIHPRPASGDYAVSQQTPSATYAASIVPRDEVKHLFAVDISNSYVVLEVACYPSSAGSVQLSADDFMIKSGAHSAFTHPADAVTVAAVIQEKNTPPAPSNRTTTVVTNANVGYESATDPVTGRRVHGVYTDAGAGVAVGGPDLGPAGPPPPGSTAYDRMTLQQQLEERAFPEGMFNAPVAGFLYFPAKEIKKKNGAYELDYLVAGSGTVRLQVPLKAH